MTILVRRMRERKLVQWALAYLAGAWLLLQVFGELRDDFGWSPVAGQLLTVLLAVAFLGALVLAWYHGEKGHQRVTGIELLLLGGILALAGAAVAWVGTGVGAPASAGGTLAPRSGAAPADAAARSIAVLPFDNPSAEQENAYFASGVHEEILTQLLKIGTLKVISRSSVLRYAAVPRNLREIGEALGVATVLEGSVQRAGSRVRISAQLIDARTDRQLWAERYDRDLSDIFAIQSEVALEIARQLNATLSRAERQRIERRPTENLAAYDLYLKGRQVSSNRSREGIQQSVHYFEEAIRLDSTSAAAHAGLADAYTMLGLYGWLPPGEAIWRARSAASQALALDPNSAEAHTARGKLLDESGEWEAAEQSYHRALELRPNHAQAHHWYGMHLIIRGRNAEGLRAIRRAGELDPLSPPLGPALSLAFSLAGEHAAAVATTRRTVEIEPSMWGGHLALAATLAAEGRLGEAAAAARQVEATAGSSPMPLGTAGALYARAGEIERAREVLARLERESPVNGRAAQAVILANLGQMDSAFALLNRQPRWSSIDLFGLRGPLWEPVRGDPRWPALLRHLGIE